MNRAKAAVSLPIVVWIARFILPGWRDESTAKKWALDALIFVTCTPFVVGAAIYKAGRKLLREP